MTPDQSLMVFVIIIGIMVLSGLILLGICYFYLVKSVIQGKPFYLPNWMCKIINKVIF